MAFLIGGANSAADTAFSVANSCRFDDGSSAYMHKTPGGAGNQRKFTFSTCFKLGNSTANLTLFATGADGSNRFWIMRHNESSNDSQIKIDAKTSDTQTIELRTNASFRDPTAWIHLVVAVDTEQGTSTNRVKTYINGTQITSFNQTTYPDEDHDTEVNKAAEHRVGRYNAGDYYFDGYLAETVFIDGTQYAASDFGEFDSDSPTIWKPKDVSGLTFGTNGFYLDFEASDNLGNDANGGTDLTETGLAATDQCTDTPTNNFCTLNPLTKLADATLSEGNTSVTYGTSSGRRPVFGTFAVSTGKWYFEMKCIATSQTVTEASFGFSNTFDPEAIGVDVHTNNGFAVAYRSTDQSIYTGTTAAVTSLGDMGVNDLFACVLDLDSGTQTLKIQKGGDESWNTASLASQTAGDNYPYWTPIVACSSDAQTFTLALNFGNPSYSLSSAVADANGYGAFEYAPPSGYYALCTKNLAEFG